MRRLPPLGPIEAFVAVARYGSVKNAAEWLALSSPALTRRLQALEHYVGKGLLDRSGPSVRLNPEGARLLAALAPHVDGLSSAMRDVQERRDDLRLRIAVPSLFAAQRLVPSLASLRSAHPELHIDIDTATDRLRGLGEELDASVLIARDVAGSHYRRLIERGRIVAIASRALQQEERLHAPRDLERVPVLVHSAMPDSFAIWRDALGLDGLVPGAGSRFDAGQLLLDAAGEGLGVAMMLESHLAGSNDPRLVRLFDERVDSPYAYWFAATEAAMERPAVRIFHDWLFDRFAA